MWRHIPCRWCEPPVWKRQPTEGPKGRHTKIVSALRALDITFQRLPVAYTTGKGCVVPLGLRIAQLENSRSGYDLECGRINLRLNKRSLQILCQSVLRRKMNRRTTASKPNQRPVGIDAIVSNAMTSIRFLLTIKLCSGPGAGGTPGQGGSAR